MHKLITEMLGKAADREDGGIGEGADGAACHLVADRIQQIQVFHTAFAFNDAVDDAVEPACTFSARRTLAARLVVVEVAQALKGFDHAHVFVHHDNRAGTQHRACFGNRVIVHIGLHHDIGRQYGSGRTAGDNGFEFFTAAHTACHFQDFGKRCA